MAACAEPPRGFKSRLQDSVHRPALIAEVKRASPSQGLIRHDFDPVAIARSYEEAGADALSVLTDAPYFQGSLEHFRTVKKSVALPCLRKDFMLDSYQVFESRAAGADAILLIVAALEQAALIDLQDLGKALGMDVLVEVHTAAEAERALEANADLIGVNNRSLADFTTDLATAEAILPMLSGHCTVAESAIEKVGDVARMERASARAVLVGTAFCSSQDTGGKVREVMGW